MTQLAWMVVEMHTKEIAKLPYGWRMKSMTKNIPFLIWSATWTQVIQMARSTKKIL